MFYSFHQLTGFYLSFQVCPICASLPGGDPNHVTDDLAAHLTLEHRAPREIISFFVLSKLLITELGSKFSFGPTGITHAFLTKITLSIFEQGFAQA